jgi:hypothetical protein
MLGGHAVERVLAQLRIARGGPDMAVAVDDAGRDELASKVDHRGAGRRRKAGTEVADATLLHDDRDVGLGRRPGAVDQGGVGQCNGLGGGGARQQDRRAQAGTNPQKHA